MGLTRGYWRDRRVLVTGHTGFKGAWLCLWLTGLGARVTGYALAPPTQPSLFGLAGLDRHLEHHEADLRDRARLTRVVEQCQPEIVFHLAAQSLVLQGYRDPVDTFATNVLGTVHLLEALRGSRGLRAVVVATSDKCYQNDDLGRAFVETDPLGGGDPYSASKACTEIASHAYARAFFSEAGGPRLATVRAGNVIGGGDFAADRLVPDLVRAFQAGRPAHLRSPESVRPWQHVLEPLDGYLVLAERLAGGAPAADAYNFGPDAGDARPVAWIAAELAARWPGDATWQADAVAGPAEAARLHLDCGRARRELGWQPRLRLDDALSLVADWHTQVSAGASAAGVCAAQIEAYRERTVPAGARA